MALVVCETCGKKTDEAAFCEKCGAELPAVASAEETQHLEEKSGGPQSLRPIGVNATASAVALDDLDTGMETADIDSTIDTLPAPPSLVQKEPVPLQSSTSCVYLNVEHDQSRVFVVGQTMNFRFALTPLADGLSEVFVAVVFEGRRRKDEIIRLGWIPCRGERRELRNINFAAPEAGSLGFSFYFGFKQGKTEFVFEADGEHKVWPSQTRATDVVRNLEINIQNSGHATDFNLSGIKDHLHPEEALEDIIDRLHRMPPVWSNLRLYGSTWRPPRFRRQHDATLLAHASLDRAPSNAACVGKLTLKTDGRLLHLLSGDQISLGKNRQNDAVTRLFENGNATAALNSKISRHHCVIERHGKKCYVVDRGDYPGEGSRPSAHGVFLDGKRIPASGRRELAAKKSSCKLTLAGSDADRPGVFGIDLKFHKAETLIMRRCDSIPETYVALWKRFSLGDADPDFDGMVVWREGNGFGYATAETEGWLEPGMVIQTPQCEVSVEGWSQHGL